VPPYPRCPEPVLGFEPTEQSGGRRRHQIPLGLQQRNAGPELTCGDDDVVPSALEAAGALDLFELDSDLDGVVSGVPLDGLLAGAPRGAL
jgi:hypothetical protein